MHFHLASLTSAAIFLCLISGCEQESPDARAVRIRAESGDAKAQVELGDRYQQRRGVPKNFSKAVSWFRKAAEQGDAEGQAQLGECYSCGIGVPQNDAEAVKWFRKGAEQENATAQEGLGFHYQDGRGVPKDLVSAHCFFSLSFLNGYPYAADSRNALERQMTSDQIADAKNMVQRWLEDHPKK